MMGFHFCVNNMVVIVIAAAVCASVATASILEDDKHLLHNKSTRDNDTASSQYTTDKIISKSSPSSIKNLTSVKHDKKMVHRLIGGHVKIYPKVTAESNDERETPPAVTWDDGLMMSSAGNGKENTSQRRDDDDEKKTLSQQVKEGKYGLIQNEIYPTPPKRPGIISYLGNPEVPKDTAQNLGGLEEEEIWLAENHLLVIRGGKFPDHGTRTIKNEGKWPPIDDYKAPLRQVKIPPKPKVPPPFPVQLTEGGPVQIIRANGSVININGTIDYDEYANYPEGFFPGEAPFYPFPSNTTDVVGYPGNFTSDNGSYLPPEGSLGPFYHTLPPGAVFLPPPNNQSDYDEEDQSIYYPPPYSFYYQQNNATPVPPGPLVPGIVLPPPPNFFSSLDEPNSPVKNKFNKYQTTTTTTTESEVETTTYPTTTYPTTTTYTPRRKTVTKPYKSRFPTTTTITPTFSTRTKPTTRIQPEIVKNIGRTKSRFSTTVPTTTFTSTPSYVESTTSRPDKPTTISDYYNVKTEIENHLIDLGAPQGGQWTGIVGNTAVPLLAYYATTSSPLERTRSSDETRPIHVKSNGEDISSKNQASYYYYEQRDEEPIRTTTNSPPVYFKTTTEESSQYYNVEPITRQRDPKKQYYSVEMIPSQQTANDYDIKLSSLIKSTQNFGPFNGHENLRNMANYNVDRFRTQSQRNSGENNGRYYQPVTIKPYFTTQRPRYYYQTSQSENYDYREEQELKPSPVYQYSYEAAGFDGKREKESYREEEPATYGDYRQPASTSGQYYDYDTQQGVEKVPKSEELPYLVGQRGNSYPVRNSGQTINATPNPHHAYYTKQDEQLLDDVTKQYFTIFGKKLPESVLPNTTPLYRVVGTTTENPINSHNVNSYVSNQYEQQPGQRFKPPKVKVHYGDHTQRPYSLEGDTLVNYKNPLPPINPDAEFIDVQPNKPISDSQRQIYRTEHISPIAANRPAGNYIANSNHRETYNRNRGRYNGPPISLANDIAVNYRDPRPPINPDAEFIAPVQGQGNQGNRGGSYFAYQLPGNGGHFYFLTPQAISQRPNVNGPGDYLYPKSSPSRIIRRRRITTSEG